MGFLLLIGFAFDGVFMRQQLVRNARYSCWVNYPRLRCALLQKIYKLVGQIKYIDLWEEIPKNMCNLGAACVFFS